MLHHRQSPINSQSSPRVEVLGDGRVTINSRRTHYRIVGDQLHVDAGGRGRKLFRIRGAWALSKPVIGAAWGRRCTEIRLVDGATTWSADLAQLQRHGADLGDGRVSLALRHWTQREAAGPPEDDAGAQMALLAMPAGAPGKAVRP